VLFRSKNYILTL